MSYDSPDFRVQMTYGPIFGSFSQIIVTEGSSEARTSEDSRDRVEFFRNVKLLDFKVLPLAGLNAGRAIAGVTQKIQLMVGSDVVGSATLLGSDDDGNMVNGSIGTGTLAEVSSNEELSLRHAIVDASGTAGTFVAGKVEAYVLYEHRFA